MLSQHDVDIKAIEVYAKGKRKQLKLTKIGGSSRVKASELERYLRAAERNTAA